MHFAVDDSEVRICTELKGKASWFLPFNKGWNDGAGNPPNPHGLKTDYLWKEILTPPGLTDILENYAQIVEEKDRRHGQEEARRRSSRASTSSTWCGSCWPMCAAHGAGRRYLIQHSAGSGKSNSIAWLAHQLIGVEDGRQGGLRLDHRRHRPAHPRRADPGHDQAVRSGGRDGRPRRALGRPAEVHRSRQEDHHLDGAEVSVHPRRDRQRASGQTFAIIIDEAHSSQGGKTSAAMSAGAGRSRRTTTRKTTKTRSTSADKAHGSAEDADQRQLLRLHRHAEEQDAGDVRRAAAADAEGKVKHRPFHSYTMKQAIQEGFILDVLKNYTPVTATTSW